MSAAQIVLVRHGSTAWSGVRYCGRSDPPLSGAGRAEARRLADQLRGILQAGTRVVSSPSLRALATAEAIVEAAALDRVVVDERWREADVGLAEGRTFDELTGITPGVAAALAHGDVEIDWPGGETSRSLAERVRAAWLELARLARPTVVVTHSGPLMHAIAFAEGRAARADDLLPPAGRIALTVTPDGLSRESVLPSRA